MDGRRQRGGAARITERAAAAAAAISSGEGKTTILPYYSTVQGLSDIAMHISSQDLCLFQFRGTAGGLGSNRTSPAQQPRSETMRYDVDR